MSAKPDALRVLIATNMYPFPGAPSFGVFVKEQAEALRELGVEVEVSAHMGRVSKLNYVRGIFEIARRLRASRFDLIHSHHPYSTLVAWLGRMLAGRRRVPMIQTFHDGEIFRKTKFKQGFFQRLKYSLAIKRFALRRCAFVIQTHPAMLEVVFGKDAARGIPSCVIPAGIDLRRFGGLERGVARERLGFVLGKKYIFFPAEPGRPEKRFDLAQRAFELLRAGNAECELKVGGGIDYDDMPAWIVAADAIIITSDYESSPVTVREALACETPIVSTDIGDVRLLYGHCPGVALCDTTPDSLAGGLRRALAVPRPYGGRKLIDDLQLDRLQVGRRVAEVYAQVVREVGGKIAT